MPTTADWARSRWAIARGTVLGFFVGILPGAGSTIASFFSYAVERKYSKHPEEFGHGAIEGVAGPESANNAASAGAMVPLLTLGIPGSGTTAILLGGLMMWGLRPGPLLFEKNPDFVWGLIASMYIGNVMLLILNLPMVGLWVQLLRVPYSILAPVIVLFCCVGVFSVRNSVFDIWVMGVFGVIGYIFRKVGMEPGPLILAFVLGPILERSIRQALLMSAGSPAIFFTRPISGTLMVGLILFIAFQVFRNVRKQRQREKA
jgi:putative tricarboxylic transport membrane protein